MLQFGHLTITQINSLLDVNRIRRWIDDGQMLVFPATFHPWICEKRSSIGNPIITLDLRYSPGMTWVVPRETE